jgi:peptidyl-prolyl cis-trans isomerase B (cyclophilin B)
MKKSFIILLTLLVSINCLVYSQDKRQKVLISTDYGDITIELYNETPKHRDNFIKLAESGFYDGTLFHRVIKYFMIQGGDPASKNAAPGAMLGNGGPGYTIPAEINPKFYHKKGALSAARQGDQVNPTRASSGSQFYIVQGKPISESDLKIYEQRMNVKFSPEQIKTYTTIGGAYHLDGAYTVFGEVIEGLDVIDKIASVQKDSNDRPVKDIKMTVKVIK